MNLVLNYKNVFCFLYKGQKPPYVFHLGVKFYAADPTRLREELTR